MSSPNTHKTRRASHAGSWYNRDPSVLSQEMDKWLSKVKNPDVPARAIIAPHAGYRYSGPCAAHAYKQIDPSTVTRVFILGPSHKVHLRGCALSACQTYQTPFYNLEIDEEINKELMATNEFDVMTLEVDEDEHSIEMHLPFLAKVMGVPKSKNFTIVPILVGSTQKREDEKYAKIFSKYLLDPGNLFIISSDFCHWGSRFRYTEYHRKYGQIFESIKAIDYMGMTKIEQFAYNEFTEYLVDTSNTICGRHPISVFLCTMKLLEQNRSINLADAKLKFLNYEQSDKCRTADDSSVSYAAATLVMKT